MLAAHVDLSASGVYTPHLLRSKLSYSVMLLVGSHISEVFALQLAQATTIAARYSVVRDQGLDLTLDRGKESPIIHYKHQHVRLLTLISKTYAMFFGPQSLLTSYARLREQQASNAHNDLPSFHALAAGLKGYVTSEAVDGAEEARKLCGGHGYMANSGLPDIIGACAGGTTFEGENYVMWQQIGRYLLKQVDKLRKNRNVDEQVQYFSHATESPNEDWLDSCVQIEIYHTRARRLVLKAHKMRAHIEYNILTAFDDYIAGVPPTTPPTLFAVLTRLRNLFALSNIIHPRSTDALSFLETGVVSAGQLDTIRAMVNTMMEELLPDVIALTDAWDFSDASLCSALGMYDGNVYETIIRWVKQMPINKQRVHSGWRERVDPILKAGGTKAKL